VVLTKLRQPRIENEEIELGIPPGNRFIARNSNKDIGRFAPELLDHVLIRNLLDGSSE